MSEYVDFRYMPLEGKITGKQVLKQTEDAINDIGEKVYSLDIDSSLINEAIETSEAAMNIAESALSAVTTGRSVWFNNVSDMIDFASEVGVVAETKGYYLVNDGGGAVYIIRQKTGGDVVDGGSIIQLYDESMVAQLVTDGEVNVKQFGAIGNGVDDDSTAFQNTSTYAQTNGFTAFVALGTYNVTETITGTFNSFGEVTIVGGGTVDIVNLHDVVDDVTAIKEEVESDTTSAQASATSAATSATNAASSATSASTALSQLIAYLDTKETLTAPAIDTTLSVSGAAADARVVGGVVESLTVSNTDSSLFEMGSIRYENGTNISNTARIRTKEKLAKNIAGFKVATNYEYIVVAYQKTDGTYVGFWNGSSFVTSATWSASPNVIFFNALNTDYEYRLIVRRTDLATMSIETDGNAITFIYSTDTTLSVEGASADALSVGNQFADYRLLTQNDIRSGYWTNGSIGAWNRRLCTKELISVKKGDIVLVTTNILKVAIAVYPQGETSAVGYVGWETATTETPYIVPADGGLMLNFRADPDNILIPSNYDATIKICSNFNGHIQSEFKKAETNLYGFLISQVSISNFEYGTIYNGLKTDTTNSRYRTINRICLPVPLTITPSLGYSFSIVYYDSQGEFTGSGLITTSITIPAWTIFHLLLRNTSDNVKGAENLGIIYNAFTFELDCSKALEEKSESYSSHKVPLIVTDDMKGWSYYIGAGNNNHVTQSTDCITFAVPMSKGDSIRVSSDFGYRTALARYADGSLDDKTTLISTTNAPVFPGEDIIVVDNDYTVFISVWRNPNAATGDYSDFPDNIEINLCSKNELKFNGFVDVPSGSEIQEKAFVSSYNEIEWETHARNFAEMFNGVTKADSFLFFTDCHIMHMSSDADRNNLMWKPRVRRCLSYIEQLFYATPCNTLLNGGDWLGSSDTRQQALYMLSYLNGAMREKFQDHFAMVLGNHDTNYQGTTLTQGAIDATYGSGRDKMYFLYHAPTYDMYCFDTGIETSQLTTSYYQGQVSWFADALQSNTAEHIVIFLHMIYTSGTTFGQMFTQLSLVAKAFNERGSYTYDGVTYDYTNATGKVAFALGGHVHSDREGELNGIPFATTTNASGYGNFVTLPLDLCLIDWGNAKLKMYRAQIGETTGNVREINIVV